MRRVDSRLIPEDKFAKGYKKSANDRDDTEDAQQCRRHFGRERLRSEVMNRERIDAAENEQAAKNNSRIHHNGFTI